MIPKVQILLVIAVGVSGSFLQSASEFRSAFNSTFLNGNDLLFKPTSRIENKDSKNDLILKKILQSEPLPEESTIKENISEESIETTPRYSSRYSIKQKSSEEIDENQETEEDFKNEDEPKRSKSYVHLEDYDDSEEQKNDSEVVPTTSEPESPKPYSSNEELKNYDKKDEEKRSVDDYHNAGSKNYHSVQTPLNKIKFQGPQDSEEDQPNWSSPKSELEELNEISDEKSEEIELKKLPNDLESAVRKDEHRFEYNDKTRRQQNQKSLDVEEEKDHKGRPYQNLKQYEVQEKELKIDNHRKLGSSIWSTKPTLIYSPKDIFETRFSSSAKPPPKTRNYLGPVVFNHLEHEKNKQTTKQSVISPFAKGLVDREKLDRENLAKPSIQKSFQTGSEDFKGFNHFEESNEMYNAILANIHSVFDVKTQQTSGSKNNYKTANFDYTWSFPLLKHAKSN